MNKSDKKTYCILHDIRSVHNVGSFFRTSDASGVDLLYFTGYTPTPLDRFGRPRGDVSKVALGAEKRIPWERRDNLFEILDELREKGFVIVAIEQDVSSVDYTKLSEYKEKDVVFIFGNEVDGLSKEVIEVADVVCEIGMSGSKESLNVSVVGGIILLKRRDG